MLSLLNSHSVANFVDFFLLLCFEALDNSILWIADNTSSPTHEPRPLLQTIFSTAVACLLSNFEQKNGDPHNSR